MSFSTFVNKKPLDVDSKDYTPVVIAPGRFNPPHLGHKRIISKLQELALDLNATPLVIIIDSGKRDTRNPLTGELRESIINKLYPSINTMVCRNAYEAVITLVEEKSFLPIGGVTGVDRANTYKDLIGRLFGEGAGESFTNVILERDPDADNHTSISSTKVREAIYEDNQPRVRALTGLNYDDSLQLMRAVQEITGVK